MTDEVSSSLREANTELRKFPANSTDKIQPADQFVISKIKDAHKRRWETFMADQIRNGQWMSSEDGSSGKLNNP